MNVTIALSELRACCKAANRYGNKLIVRRGRFNGVFVWLSADEYFCRSALAKARLT